MKKKICIGLLSVLCSLFLFGFGGRPPISVTWRTSWMDSSSRVMQVTNRNGSETLVIRLSVKNKKLTRKSSYVFKVRPGDTEEIGMLEMDWAFMPGDTYSLKADGYIFPVKGTVP